jgi:hypothetical protein
VRRQVGGVRKAGDEGLLIFFAVECVSDKDQLALVRLGFLPGTVPEDGDAILTPGRMMLRSLRATGEIPVVDDLAIAEAYFTLSYHYRIPKAEVLAALDRFLESGDVIATGVAAEILKIENLAVAKPGFVERLIHASYQRRDTMLVTFEKASAKLPGDHFKSSPQPKPAQYPTASAQPGSSWSPQAPAEWV